MTEIALALGGNIGDTAGYMKKAVEMLEAGGVEVSAEAKPIQTAPVDCAPGTAVFTNTALTGKFGGSPFELLDLCQHIERELGRPELHGHNAPRTIDLDIVDFGGIALASPRLTLPHPRASGRLFVLEPLAEIAPEMRIGNHTVSELLECLRGGKNPV